MSKDQVNATADLEAPYWAAVANEELVYQVCDDCAGTIAYAKKYCPGCGSQNLSWKRASGKGIVYSFSIVHRAPSAQVREKLPYVMALVDLEESVRRMTWIVDCPPSEVRVGMPVRAVFREQDDRTVPFFAPDESHGGEQ